MEPAASSAAAPKPPALSDQEERLRHLPDDARDAFLEFKKNGDPAALDPVIFAILEDFIPRKPEQPFASLPGTTRLIENLGFDSLAITEVVFFTEDLFGITISNEEIIQVATLDDLKGFVRRKVAPPATP